MAEHKHPNYMAIFWYLAVLTAAEIFIVLPQFRPENKLIVGTLLCIFAIWKAALVAVTGYFLLWARTDLSTAAQLWIWLPFCVVFPLWFFRYRSSLWLAVEYGLNPNP